MKAKTTTQVIAFLKDQQRLWEHADVTPMAKKNVACLIRAIAIVRLWDAGITPADVRKAERKRKGRAK